MFLSYINDINNAVTSQIKPLADDCVQYRNINNQNYQVIRHHDLDTIPSWAEKLLMELNINKCSASLLHSNVIMVFMTIIYLAQCLSGLQTMIILV